MRGVVAPVKRQFARRHSRGTVILHASEASERLETPSFSANCELALKTMKDCDVNAMSTGPESFKLSQPSDSKKDSQSCHRIALNLVSSGFLEHGSLIFEV